MTVTDQHKILPSNILPGSFSVSHDGSKIVFPAGNNLYLMNIDGSNLTKIKLPDTASSKSSPQFSFDGNNIVFITSNGICESNINGDNYRILLDAHPRKEISYVEPGFSADDYNIIFAEYNDSTSLFVSLHLFNLATMNDTIFFTFNNSSSNYYEVSPNNSVLFVMGGNIYEENLNNFTYQILALGFDAHYSFDFSLITYTDPDNTSFNVLKLKTKVKQNIKITDKFSSVGEPKLSPDGTEIIFVGVKYVL